jgi:hypothetical protein
LLSSGRDGEYVRNATNPSRLCQLLFESRRPSGQVQVRKQECFLPRGPKFTTHDLLWYFSSTVCKSICRHAPCRDDYTLEGETCDCTNGEPLSQCSANTFCSDDKCLCKPGYSGTPIKGSAGCVDINECATPIRNNCTANTVCKNTPGSFNCECANGFAGDPTSPQGCVDINECALNGAICGSNGVCQNTPGGYACQCNAGYVWRFPPSGICEDINECNTTDCGANALCTNTPGSFTCSCRAGYNTTGRPPSQPCTDINECLVIPGLCGRNATCTNTAGSFACSCDAGFEGTPPNCVDACTRTGRICGINTRCDLTVPSNPTCACLSAGYSRNTSIVNGTTFFCSDIDECALPNTCVAATQNCFNFPGTFFCGIKPWNQCPSGQDATCSPGLQCAQTSRSDRTLVCCQNTGTCSTGKCCNDAYRLDESCPSGSDDDCEGSLQCGIVLGNTRLRCCRNVVSQLGVRLCTS